jgi:predicted metalloendopeptidase
LAANYGAIGALIGHELSHSFDNRGAQFDATGRLSNWWTPEDFAHFEASCAALALQFSAYHPFPDVAVNGQQTLAENIADLAGVATSYDAWRASLSDVPAPTHAGLTADQQFFISYSQSCQTKQRERAMREQLAMDAHAPGMYEAWTVRNLGAWYAAFDVQPGDAMYLAPQSRVQVW